MSVLIPRLLIFVSLLSLANCFGGGNYAPVIERKERLSVVPERYIVTRGDTLFSIAWVYNLDHRELASTNGIRSPYTIFPGQQLQLKAARKTSRSATTNRVTKGSENSAKSRSTTKSGTSTKSVKTSKKSPAVIASSGYPFRWRWPAKGRTTRFYSSSSAVHKGIDIEGNLGESVLAANSGRVVYAGSGLVGYGELLIIKHGDRYLSAYGHNSKLLVKEGELIKVGQRIAEMGDTGTDKVKLHFEIRQDGKPVNPLTVLPKGK
jgi:lipoprotein NlpD